MPSKMANLKMESDKIYCALYTVKFATIIIIANVFFLAKAQWDNIFFYTRIIEKKT